MFKDFKKIQFKMPKKFSVWHIIIAFGFFILLQIYLMNPGVRNVTYSVFKRFGPASSIMTFGKSKGRLYAQEDLNVTFDDVAGIDEAKEELQEIIEFLKTPEKFRALGGKIPKGVLLFGATGTEKKLLAKAVAGEAGVPFFNMSGS